MATGGYLERRKANYPNVQVQVSIAASGLRDAVFTNLDPMCVLFIMEFGQENWKEVGRTETIDKNLNPTFSRQFELDFFFEEKQRLKIEVYNRQSSSVDLRKHEHLGSAECTLGKLVSCLKLTLPLTDKRKKREKGEIIVTAEKLLNESRCQLVMIFEASGLDKKDFMGSSDPYLEIQKMDSDSSFTVVYRTKHLKKTLNPKWDPIEISISQLCNGKFDRPLKLVVNDWNRDGSIKHIGECSATVRELSRMQPGRTAFNLINHKKKQKSNYSNSGVLKLMQYRTEEKLTIADYLHGGTEIKVYIAVDFTSSNGLATDPSSLHYCSPDGATISPYARAIRDVGEILEDYDSDKKIPAFGFGARIPGSDRCCDRFPLNGRADDPECNSITGVLQAYYNTVRTVDMWGPTNFAPIIQHVRTAAEADLTGGEYHILLMLTDGAISDMEETKKAIVGAAKFPVSIIIIGLGNEDFEAMEILDGDNKRLSSGDEEACRDIVQFVAFNEFDNLKLSEDSKSRFHLAREVLQEVPDQFLSYMNTSFVKPKRRRNMSTLV